MMYQLFAIIVSFLFIPILIKRKLELSHTLLVTAGILALLSGVGFEAVRDSILNIFLDFHSLSSVLAVGMVTILGGLMKNYKILDRVVESMISVVQNKKATLMIIPATIGMLIVPGGALLSAPFINNLGEEMEISPSRRAAINLVFRHAAIFLVPYSSSLLVTAAAMPELNIGRIIQYNLIFLVSMTILGYLFYIKDIENEKARVHEKRTLKSFLKLLAYASPVYVCVIINLITGLPFFITLIASIGLVYLLGDKKDFLKKTLTSFKLNSVLVIIAVFIMKGIILRMDELLSLFNNLFIQSTSIFSIMFVFLISAFFFGYITGYQSSSLIILLPMVSQLNISIDQMYVYTFFAYGCAFLGYFFSPLHLCQAFTVQHMGTTTQALYKEYKFLAPLLFLVLIISFLIMAK